MKKKILTAAILLFTSLGSRAELKLSSLIGENMVLQQQARVNLWGEADPGEEVSVTCSWDNKSYRTRTDSQGEWLLKVTTPTAGGPYALEFHSASRNKPITVRKVFIGEVWICSGQSNMVHPLRGYLPKQPIDGSETAIAESKKYGGIHFFTVKNNAADQPQSSCEGKWLAANPDNTGGFSAVGYFMALDLYKQLQVPIGMIVSAWGSSRAEAWMSPQAIGAAGGVDLGKLNAAKQVQKHPSVLYNGMIVPICKYTPKGFVWFQIAANMQDYENYPAVLSSLISSWRTLWNDDSLPFISIQGPMFPWGKSRDKIGLPLTIEKQYDLVEKVDNYWMVSSSDVGHDTEPHYPQKEVTGHRAALMALSKAYGRKEVKADAPDFESVVFKDDKAVVTFSHADDGLTVKGGEILAFELAGEDRKFHPAKARIIGGGTLVEVHSEMVAKPVALRYAFRNYRKVSLYDKHGLTPRPYRTDDWDNHW